MKPPPPLWNFSENSSILVASPVPKFILFVNYSIHWSDAGCLLQTITSLTNLFSIAVSICQMKKWANCNSHCDQTTLPMRCHALDIYWMVEFLYRAIRTLSIDQRQWKEFIGWVYGEHLLVCHGFLCMVSIMAYCELAVCKASRPLHGIYGHPRLPTRSDGNCSHSQEFLLE